MMSEPYYEEILIQYSEQLAISEDRMTEILGQLDEVVAAHLLQERIAAILRRLTKGGHYAHIEFNPIIDVYMFVRKDNTCNTMSPAQLDALFSVPS